MFKKTLVIFIINTLFLLTSISTVLAVGVGGVCVPNDPTQACTDAGYSCQETPTPGSGIYRCLESEIGVGKTCIPNDPNTHCIAGYSCQETPTPGSGIYRCLEPSVNSVFGKIQPPDALKRFIGTDPTGAAGISKFLSNFVSLIYIAATIVLVLMLLWGAWDWMTSEGDKEKLQSAQKKIMNAFIGIILFAVAFALLRVVGAFTGFTFFTG